MKEGYFNQNSLLVVIQLVAGSQTTVPDQETGVAERQALKEAARAEDQPL